MRYTIEMRNSSCVQLKCPIWEVGHDHWQSVDMQKQRMKFAGQAALNATVGNECFSYFTLATIYRQICCFPSIYLNDFICSTFDTIFFFFWSSLIVSPIWWHIPQRFFDNRGIADKTLSIWEQTTPNRFFNSNASIKTQHFLRLFRLLSKCWQKKRNSEKDTISIVYINRFSLLLFCCWWMQCMCFVAKSKRIGRKCLKLIFLPFNAWVSDFQADWFKRIAVDMRFKSVHDYFITSKQLLKHWYNCICCICKSCFTPFDVNVSN